MQFWVGPTHCRRISGPAGSCRRPNGARKCVAGTKSAVAENTGSPSVCCGNSRLSVPLKANVRFESSIARVRGSRSAVSAASESALAKPHQQNCFFSQWAGCVARDVTTSPSLGSPSRLLRFYFRAAINEFCYITCTASAPHHKILMKMLGKSAAGTPLHRRALSPNRSGARGVRKTGRCGVIGAFAAHNSQFELQRITNEPQLDLALSARKLRRGGNFPREARDCCPEIGSLPCSSRGTILRKSV